ncbi:MAG: circadian clock protein KaiC [Polyangiaceae bacterium]
MKPGRRPVGTGATRHTEGSQPSDKISSGIVGFDEITSGGLPRGRITVVLGGAGCGKTIFALQGLVAGARKKDPGLFVAFEEGPEQIIKDAQHFDWKLRALKGNGIAFFDAQLSQAIIQGGEFDLIGLLAIVGAKAKQLKCTRIVFDGLDVLLGHLSTPSLIRAEILRLREWVFATGMSCLITAKADARDGQPLSDYAFLQFIADCVVVLQHRVIGGAAIRMLRVAKYRGGSHSANELPFTITSAGIEVAAGSSTELSHSVSMERVTSGVERLDAMLGGGYYRGSAVLISGAPGTSKTSLVAAFGQAACERKEPTVYVSFDEAPEQIIRNVASIGIHLRPHVKSGVLAMLSLRARADNPEAHVARIRALLERHGAKNLIVDPLSALAQTFDDALGDRAAVQVIDVAKSRGITSVHTSLLANAAPLSEETPLGISTIADTWMHVSYVVHAGERNRALTIVKSRGTNHSNQVRELILSDTGVTLADPYIAGGEVLMGTLRWERENQDRHAHQVAVTESQLRQKQAELALAETRARIVAAHTEQAVREAELNRIQTARVVAKEVARVEGVERTSRRGGDAASPDAPSANPKPKRRAGK